MVIGGVVPRLDLHGSLVSLAGPGSATEQQTEAELDRRRRDLKGCRALS
jgi:hypothetical protein